ncbi:MAG: hypothetical protein WC297_01315 [Candidatus Paceibacterota bacterium]|jgi:hypothetical protein
MKNKKSLFIIIILALIVIGVGIFFLINKNAKEATQGTTTENGMVDCGQAEDPGCFVSRMNGCLPVTVAMTGSDNTTKIELTILGVENEKCHFQRKINDIIDLNCYFPKGTMNWDTIDQTFGNDKGLQKVVDDNCKSGW